MDFVLRISSISTFISVYFFIVLAIGIGASIAWGFGVRAVIHNKGYHEDWFWWGFFFGLIALIVALTKPDLRQTPMYYQQPTYYQPQQPMYYQPGVAHHQTYAQPSSSSAWKCPKCGEINSNSMTSCSCGTLKPSATSGAAPSTFWRCRRCNRDNPDYASTCSCGCKKNPSSSNNRALNNIKTASSAVATPAVAQGTTQETTSELDTIEKLKGYKELLDVGAITQEEFDEKKKQLLGL